MKEKTTTAATSRGSAVYAYPAVGLVLTLGNAAELTLGGDASTSESKRYVYA